MSSKVIQLYNILSHYGLLQDIEYKFPMLYSLTLLCIHFIYKSLPLLILNSQSFPLVPHSGPSNFFKTFLL